MQEAGALLIMLRGGGDPESSGLRTYRQVHARSLLPIRGSLNMWPKP